jgi:NAD(P)-dependent dehydrogenase (short-subunit alcohol dehydrogenase family)
MVIDPTDFRGGVAVITGAGSGIGAGLVTYAAGLGMRIALADVDLEAVERRVAELAAEGVEAIARRVDVSVPGDLEALAAEVYERWGTVTILVNNAGIPDAQRAHKMSLELTDAVLDTNVRGPWLLSNEVARRLIAAEAPGRIVNISSMGAFSYNGMGAALYSISKAAIHRMTEVLAVEWARFNINVNCIAPGAFSS